MNRCKWCNLNNPKYIEYHDNEWCKPNFDDKYLFEMLILESFQAGLSWECILNKREDFRKAYDNFDIEKICNYDKMKIQELLLNEKIIRNRLKINAPKTGNIRLLQVTENQYNNIIMFSGTKKVEEDISIESLLVFE